jgi:hypothetical protein
MHDKPSDKPPSTFLRVFSGAKPTETYTTLDELMEDYHKPASNDPASQPSSRNSSRATQMAGLTHHANGSLASSVTVAGSTQSSASGLHRLSRAVASMNPVSLWQKLATGRREQKDGDAAAARTGPNEEDLVERQIRAEQAYAQYKAAGKLAALGSRASSADLSVFSAGYTQPPPPPPSDSGIEMSDDLRTSADLRSSMDAPSVLSSASQPRPQRVSAPPGRASAKKKFHLRTPSLQDLKRIASDASIGIMTISPSKARAQQQEEEMEAGATADAVGGDGLSLLRSVKSRRDLARQTKLTKKVSNLEDKLEVARRELQEAMLLEKNGASTPRSASASSVSSRPGSRSTAGLHRHRFTALPTLPSASLLTGDDNEDDTHNTYDSRKAGGRSLADIPDLAPPPPERSHRRQGGAAFAGNEEADANVLHALIAEMPDAPLEPPPAISAFDSWSTDDEKKNSAAGAARRAFRKRRHSARPPSPGKPATGAERSHKRDGSGDMDAGTGASPKHKKLRTPSRRDRERERSAAAPADEGMPDAPPLARLRSVPSGLGQQQGQPTTSVKALEVLGLRDAAPPEPLLPPPPPPTLSPPSPSSSSSLQAPRGGARGLETVLEELNPMQQQNQLPAPPRAPKPILRPSPSVPASLAAAARARNVLHKHSRSMSPVKSPQREDRAAAGAARGRGGDVPSAAELAARSYRSRSVSPSPEKVHAVVAASPQRGERRRWRRRQEEVVRVWPDGVEVPPLPGRAGGQQQQQQQQQVGGFEWPDDVF